MAPFEPRGGRYYSKRVAVPMPDLCELVAALVLCKTRSRQIPVACSQAGLANREERHVVGEKSGVKSPRAYLHPRCSEVRHEGHGCSQRDRITSHTQCRDLALVQVLSPRLVRPRAVPVNGLGERAAEQGLLPASRRAARLQGALRQFRRSRGGGTPRAHSGSALGPRRWGVPRFRNRSDSRGAPPCNGPYAFSL